MRCATNGEGEGSASLYVNGALVGAMPAVASIRYQPQTDNGLPFEWVHRSRDIPPGLLQAGSNQIRVVLDGPVVMDRLHLEFSQE